MAELTRQLLLAPVTKRMAQVRNAERLYDDLDPELNYPFDFVNFRITGYHSETQDVTLVGQSLASDLRLLIDMLSRSVGMPRTAREPVLTPLALSRRINVSTKTIERWRKMGLRWRWVEPAERGRKQLVFTEAAVAQFLQAHPHRVDRARRFSKIDPGQRSHIIQRARRLAAARGLSPYQAARRLARETGRAVETIRLLLEQHDRQRPDEPIFSRHREPLGTRHKQIIARAHRVGVPIAKIAGRFGRSKPTIHRVLRERRAADLRRIDIHHIASPTFQRDDADEVLLRPQEPPAPVRRVVGLDAALADLPEGLRAIYDQTMLAADEQRTMLVRMNYLKYKAAHRRDRMDRYHPSVADISNIEGWISEALAVRAQLVRANFPHVLLITRQHLSHQGNESIAILLDLLELGNDSLIQAVDQFDFTEQPAFLPYVVWTLKRCYARHKAPTRAARRLSPDIMIQNLIDAGARAGVALTQT